MPEKTTQFVTITTFTLKERGWTDTLIKRFLPEPDLTRPNPHHAQSPPMRLYSKDRVESVEQTPEFQAAFAVAQRRRQSARKAVETKRTSTRTQVESITFSLIGIPRNHLTRRACKHYNKRNNISRFSDRSPATLRSSPEFLDRITVNYLRHHETEYEGHLASVSGKVGVRESYYMIVTRVLDAIAVAYPWLADECLRQRRMKEEEAEYRK